MRQSVTIPAQLAREVRRVAKERKDTWYKDFGSFVLCGTGEYPKTVLKTGMKPFGTPL